MSLGVVNRTTLREQVVDGLRAAILEGTFRPGDKMGEVELATQFGVSRGTVREALRTLHNSGLLEGSERNSLFVRRLSGRDINELFQVREALEGQAVAMILASPERDAVIDALERRLPESEPGMTYAERFEVDLGFHEELVRASGNAMLVSIWSGIKDLMRVTVMAAPDESGNALMTKAHHEPIIDAMRTGDPVRARAVLGDHMAAAAQVWSAKTSG